MGTVCRKFNEGRTNFQDEDGQGCKPIVAVGLIQHVDWSELNKVLHPMNFLKNLFGNLKICFTYNCTTLRKPEVMSRAAAICQELSLSLKANLFKAIK